VKALVLALALAIAPAAHAADAAAALRDKALADHTAWTLLESLTTDVGPRMVGTPGMVRAREWSVARFKALGFSNIKVEEFSKPAWLRGPESAEIVAPYAMALSISGLGRSPATPPGGIEAPVVVFKAYADLLAQPEGSLSGKIVVVNQLTPRAKDGAGYGALIPARRQGPVEAAKRGAVAYLVRSLSTNNTRLAHAGTAVTSVTTWPTIPCATLAVPDADLLERLAARGPLRMRLNLQSTVDEKAVAWNISGEIPGSERPDEVVLIGAHLDSWDNSAGALDDGAGIAMTTAAGKLIGDLPRRPRRTIRVVMFGSEEFGGSETAYAGAHKGENIVVASESDFGGDGIYALRLPEGSLQHPTMKAAAEVLAPLGVAVEPAPATSAGEDVSGLAEDGVPLFALRQDGTRYFDIHHSADDTLDKVDPARLNQSVAAWAALVYQIADSDIDFRQLKAAAQ
jgi:Zn-dependent M28 family amino/carboxypeptidase